MNSQFPLNRRRFITSLGLSAALGSLRLPTASGFPENKTQPPNIVLIMADDLGYGDLGCYGNPTIRTPHIDALAKEGMRFTDYHSNGAVCSPTRAALMTGRYQQRSGIDGVITAANHRHTGLALDQTTFAEALRGAGYATALFGKWHLGYAPEFNPVRQGFDVFRGYVSGNVDYHSHIDQAGVADWWTNAALTPEKGYVTDLITDHGVRFIRENSHRPFCLYLAHESPHYPYQGRRDKADRREGAPGPSHGTRPDKKAAYKEMIEAMDEGVGRVVQAVKERSPDRQTFLFFCSDNGATTVGSNAPWRGNKGSLWEGGHRVPAIAWMPGRIAAGSHCDQTAMAMDLFPTLLTLSGASPARAVSFDGMDLSPALFRSETLNNRSLFWAYGNQKAVRKGPWKAIAHGPASSPRWELYHLDTDPGERHQRAETDPDVLSDLISEYQKWRDAVWRNVPKRA